MKDDNLMASVAYVFGLLSGLIVYVLSKEKYVRFHAIQSMLFCILTFGVWFVIGIIALISNIVPVSNIMIGIFSLVSLGIGGIWLLTTLFLMYSAHKGEKYMLPLLGRVANTHA